MALRTAWLVQATGMPRFQVLFLPTRSRYELLQLLTWLSGLEVAGLDHDVSGKQDSSTTCKAVRPWCRWASSEQSRSAIPETWSLGVSDKFQTRGWWFHLIYGVAASVLQSAEDSC